MTGGLIDDKQWGFRAGKGCLDQIFTLKQIDEKAQEKKQSVCGIWRRHTILLIGRFCGKC